MSDAPSTVFRLDEAEAILRRTPAVLDALLRDLPEAWVRATEGADTWSAYDVVGHLCDGEETDWIPRARLLLERGAECAFEPFDRLRHRRVDHGRTIADRLEKFGQLRRESLEALGALGLDDVLLEREGLHPELGRVKLRQLLATWAAHDLDHLFQISRTLASRYRVDAGPWVAYLRVLRS